MKKLTDLFSAIDPGWVRLEQSIKGTLAFVTAAIMTAIILSLFAPPSASSAIAYSFLSAFITFMTVGDNQVRTRQHTLLLAIIPYAVAPFIVALIEPSLLLDAIVLLVFVFFTYYLRRYGMRATELALCGVFAYYFSLLFGASWESAPWFAVGAVVGILSAYSWQFLVRPYSPETQLRRSLVGFDQNMLAVVQAIEAQLSPAEVGEGENESGQAAAAQTKEVAAAFSRVQKSRQVIEQYLVAVRTVRNFPEAKITQLRLQLFNAEQGLQRLSTGSQKAMQNSGELPDSLRASFNDSMQELQEWLGPSDEDRGEPQASMMAELAKIETMHKQMIDDVEQLGDESLVAELRPAFLQIATGSLQIARAAGLVRVLAYEEVHAAENAPAPVPLAQPQPSAPPAPPNASFMQRLHPTTKLGLQAVIAVGTALLVCWLLGLEHPNWAFWTAFIVIAGSTGESVRKILYRVAGTILGAVVGTLLVIILPPNTWLTVGIAVLCLSLALYTRIINYAWTCFWITVFVALLYGLKGEDLSVILITRPVNTTIGALIAVAVVWFVFPLHAGARFHMGLALYLKTLEQYVSALVATWLGQSPATTLGDAKVQLEDSYEKLSQAFPAIAFEYNPISQARSPLTSQTTIIEAIHIDIARLSETISTDNGLTTPANPAVVRGLQATFQGNIHELQAHIAETPTTLRSALPHARSSRTTSAPPAAAQSAQRLAAFSSIIAEGEAHDWQQAVISFGQLNHSIAMLSDEIERTQSRRPSANAVTSS